MAASAQAQTDAAFYEAARDAGASPADARALAIPVQTALLRASNAEAYDNFGSSVAVAGDVAVVGARDESGPENGVSYAGAAYVFERRADGTWVETAILRASDAASADAFGGAVSISEGVIVVGAYIKGAAYVFERGAGGAWAQTAILRATNATTSNFFGLSVGVSGGVAVVGAYAESDNSGAAYVFERGAGGAWTQTARLRASNADSGDRFGQAVAVSGTSVVVGAWREAGPTNGSNQSGAAYVFDRGAGGAWTETAILRASNSETEDYFGISVAISRNVAVVGAFGEDGPTNNLGDAGAAYVFERGTGGAWTQTELLRASTAELFDSFGGSVSVSGSVAVVGARSDDASGNGPVDSGAAYVFERGAGGAWAQTSALGASNADESDRFGTSVAVSGNVVIAGVPGDDGPANAEFSSGAAYVFESPAVKQTALFNPTPAQGDGRGYRLLGAPAPSYDVTDLAGLNLVQGIPAGANAATHPAQYPTAAPNLYTVYAGDGTYVRPDADDVLVPGRGFFWQLYDRDIVPVRTSFGGGTSTSVELTDFALIAPGTAATSNVSLAFADNVGAGRDDFQMLANPFGRSLAVSGITVTGGTIQGGDVFQAFNPNGNTYQLLLAGSRLAVWQGVFAELVPTTPGGAVTVTYSYAATDTNAPPPFYGRGVAGAATPGVRFTLAGTLADGTTVADEAAVVRLDAAGQAGWDALDASKLTPPTAAYALVAPVTLRNGAAMRLAVDTRAEGVAASVPLALTATAGGTFTLAWTANVPDGWSATLRDAATGQTVDLAVDSSVAFTLGTAQDWATRFTVDLTPRGATAGDGTTAAVFALSAPRPNPTTGAASLTLTMDRPQRVRAVLLDALGREVAVLHEGEAAGVVALTVDGRALAPGVYVVRAAGSDASLVRRLTITR